MSKINSKKSMNVNINSKKSLTNTSNNDFLTENKNAFKKMKITESKNEDFDEENNDENENLNEEDSDKSFDYMNNKIKEFKNDDGEFEYSDENPDFSDEDLNEENDSIIESKKEKTKKMDDSFDEDDLNNIDKNEVDVFEDRLIREKEEDEFFDITSTLDLPCRSTEQNKIEEYIKNGLITSGAYSSLYISGMPGTGKTASVLASMAKLKAQFAKDKNSNLVFDGLIINGMKIGNSNTVYKQIYYHIFKDKKNHSNNKCCNMLDSFFKNRNSYNMKLELNNPKNPHTIILIDEIDCLISKKMSLLYNLFNWTTYPYSKLLIISISNTIDLPQKTLSKVSSRMGNNHISFSPYQKHEFEKIIDLCLPYKNLFTSDAINYSCSKVASISGDIRRILNILKTALKNLLKLKDMDIDELKGVKNGIITLNDVKNASSELYDNKIKSVTSGLKIFEKILILAIAVGMNESHKLTVEVVYERFTSYCKKIKLENFPGFGDFRQIMINLLKLKLIIFSDQSKNFVSNNVYIQYRDEIINSFENDIILKPILDTITIN